MTPRIFGVDYPFLSCGDVFTVGLANAAAEIGVPYEHAQWDAPDLLERVAMFEPTLVFVVHGRRFVARYPRLGATFAPAVTAVWLLDEPYEVDDTSRWSSAFDYVFVNDAATLHRHPGSVLLPVCYDADRHTDLPAGSRQHVVGFIGGGNSARNAVLDALAEAGLLSYVIGGAWSSPRVNALVQGWNIAAAYTPWWYRRTQIVVNVYREQHHFNVDGIAGTAFNPRVYEALACGALVVSERRPECSRLPAMPTFETPAECVDVVRRMVDDPAERACRLNACRAATADDTYDARLRTVLEAAGVGVPA